MDALSVILTIVSSILIGLFITKRRKYKLPPGPVGLPIIGYLPFMGKYPPKILKNLSDKYGKVIGLYLGRTYVVVCNDYESAKEALSNPALQDRPPKLFDIFPGGLGLASINGPEWVEQRRFTMKSLRDIGLTGSAWEKDLECEVQDFIQYLYSTKGKPVDVCDDLTAGISNNITSLLMGRRLLKGDPRRRIIDDGVQGFSHAVLQTGMVSVFPALMHFLASIGLTWLAEDFQKMHKMHMFLKSEAAKKETSPSDDDVYLQRYLQVVKSNHSIGLNNSYHEQNMIGNLQAMFIGGGETIRITIMWFFLAMVINPNEQEKIHKEVFGVFGNEGRLRWSDRAKLPYTYAAIQETMRWQALAPLNVARRARVDTKISGFDIPKGTHVLANIWWIQNDPKNWENPEKFIPERFLKQDGTTTDRPENFAPFSIGRRKCPGETVSMIELLHYISAILLKFKILPLEDQAPNLQGILGINYHPVQQKLRFVPRSD